jgi:hypothetical protein
MKTTAEFQEGVHVNIVGGTYKGNTGIVVKKLDIMVKVKVYFKKDCRVSHLYIISEQQALRSSVLQLLELISNLNHHQYLVSIRIRFGKHKNTQCVPI